MKKTDVEEYVIKDISKDCNWYERIIVRIFDKEFVKVYKIGATYGFNNKWKVMQ